MKEEKGKLNRVATITGMLFMFGGWVMWATGNTFIKSGMKRPIQQAGMILVGLGFIALRVVFFRMQRKIAFPELLVSLLFLAVIGLSLKYENLLVSIFSLLVVLIFSITAGRSIIQNAFTFFKARANAYREISKTVE